MNETPKQAARRLSETMLAKGFQPVALHAYTDEHGEPIYWRIRMKHPETGEKWIRPAHVNGQGYQIGEPSFPGGKPLYRLHELAAQAATPVWYVEGENCADALAKLGVLATTAGSAQSDDKADFAPLKGRTITIWPDNDQAGIDHGKRVAAKLAGLGCSVETIDACALGLQEKGDCVNWLQARQSAKAADLTTLPRCALAQTKPAAQGPAVSGWRLELLRGSDVKPEPIEWIWDGWLARGKFHMLAGAPGTGKTTISLSLAATVTKGGRWPDGTRAALGTIAIWSGEDDTRNVLAPRLMMAGADMSKVLIVGQLRDEHGERRAFDPAADLDLLTEALAKIEGLTLLIVDPVVSAVTGDSHKNTEVRRGLQPVVTLAERMNCAVLGISHFSKGTAGRDPTERVTGSVAFGALPRVVMATAKRTEDQGGGRMLVRSKSNIGPDGGGFGYDFEQKELPADARIIASAVLWGDALTGTARELLAAAETVEEPGERSATADAAELLAELLADGPMRASEAQGKLKGAGFTDKPIRSARERLGVRPKRKGFGRDSVIFWTLPGSDSEAHRCPDPPLMPIDAVSQREGNNDINGASMAAEPAAHGEKF